MTASAVNQRLDLVAIDQIDPSKTNPRTHFDEAKLQELADSIKEKGVVQPALLRPKGSRFEIIAGERRFRASKLAKATHLLAVIRDYTDEQVLEIQLIENIQRDDLTALEQADGYRRLIALDPKKHTCAAIAARIGKSEAWVWDRLKLKDLTAEAKVVLERGLISTGHAVILARLKPEDQQRCIDVDDDSDMYGMRPGSGIWRHDSGAVGELEDDKTSKKKPGKFDGLKPCSVRELEDWVRTHVRFDVSHAAKAQPLAFAATEERVQQAAALPGRGKKLIAITHEYRVADDARADDECTYGSQSWERADGQEKSKTCEHSVLGVVVAGRGYGDTLQVCVARDKCKVHFGQVLKQRAKTAKLRESGQAKAADKQEAARLKREATEAAKREAHEKQFRAVSAALQIAIKDAVKKLKTPSPAVLAAALQELRMPKTPTKDLARMLVGQAFRRLNFSWIGGERQIREWAKLLGVDLKAIDKSLATPAKKTKAA